MRALEELRGIAASLQDIVGGALPAEAEEPPALSLADALTLRRRR